MRSPPSGLNDSTVNPAFFIAPALKPLTVCFCHPIFSMISAKLASFLLEHGHHLGRLTPFARCGGFLRLGGSFALRRVVGSGSTLGCLAPRNVSQPASGDPLKTPAAKRITATAPKSHGRTCGCCGTLAARIKVDKNLRKPSEYFKSNIYVDTMGPGAIGLKAMIEMCGVDRVLFGTDFGPVPMSPKLHIDLVDETITDVCSPPMTGRPSAIASTPAFRIRLSTPLTTRPALSRTSDECS